MFVTPAVRGRQNSELLLGLDRQTGAMFGAGGQKALTQFPTYRSDVRLHPFISALSPATFVQQNLPGKRSVRKIDGPWALY